MELAPHELGDALAQLAAPALDAASHARPAWLVLGLGLHSASLFCRVRIWQKLLRAALPGRAVPLSAAAGPYLGSVGASVVLPLRGGDAVRVALARRTLPEAASVAVLATLAAEAIPGLVVLPVLVALALVLGVLPVSLSVSGALVFGCGALTVGVWRVARLGAVPRRAHGWPGRLLTDLVSGLRLVGSPGRFARTVGPLAALEWTLRIATMAALLRAFGLDAAAGAAVVSIDSLTTVIPVVPNGAGVQQAAVATALHTHASTATLLAFATSAQILLGAVNVITGALALVMLLPPRPTPPPVLACGGIG